MDRALNVLLIEDNPGDADLLSEFLDRAGVSRDISLRWVDSLARGIRELAQSEFDALLLDLTLPDSTGLETFAQARTHAVSIPIVVLTGLADERLALRAVQMGAQDYLIKGQVDGNLLVRAIRYAVERNRAEVELRRTEKAYERERTLAEMLQRSLLPQALPRIPGLSITARYQAGGPDVEVGGDWYDAIILPTGNIGLVIGDVVGKGVPAAAIMGQLRNAVRAYALEGHGPQEVTRLMGHFVHELTPNQIATMLYAEFDPTSRRMTYVNAGHPPAVVVPPQGEPYFLDEAGSLPLGVGELFQAHREQDVQMSAGSVLVMYTDGLVERRNLSIAAGFDSLVEALEDAPHDLEMLCDHTLERMRDPGATYDDIAMLAFKVLPPFEGTLKLSLDANQDVLSLLRRSLSNWLDGAGLERDVAFDVIVAVSEAAANVVEHAYGPSRNEFHVEAQKLDDEVVVLIRDTGSWRDPRSKDRGRGIKMMEALMDSVEISTDDQGTTVRLTKHLPSEEATS